jgi:hypothetical protein
LPKEKNRPIGENWPNLVTLMERILKAEDEKGKGRSLAGVNKN